LLHGLVDGQLAAVGEPQAAQAVHHL
jgi:hypothetical protein